MSNGRRKEKRDEDWASIWRSSPRLSDSALDAPRHPAEIKRISIVVLPRDPMREPTRMHPQPALRGRPGLRGIADQRSMSLNAHTGPPARSAIDAGKLA